MDDLLDVVYEFIKGEVSVQSKRDHLEGGTGERRSKCLFLLEVSHQPVWERLTFPASRPYSYNWGRGSQEHPNGYTLLKTSRIEILHLVESLGILKAPPKMISPQNSEVKQNIAIFIETTTMIQSNVSNKESKLSKSYNKDI